MMHTYATKIKLFINKATLLKCFICMLLVLGGHNSYGLNLISQVDRTSLSIGETLTLTVTLDKQNANPVNFNALQIQFDVLRQQRSSQTNIVNGRIDAKTRWTLILAPKETGTLIIPSFKTEGIFSEPISIKVTKDQQRSSQQGQSEHREVWLEASLNKKSVYVQEQLIYTLRLYYRITLSGYSDENITINNTAVEAINENTYKKKIDGISYNVLEKTYAIYPQTSGTLTIPEQQWQLERPARNFGFGSNNVPFKRVITDSKEVEVKPVPAESTAEYWLPSSAVVLSQKWQQSIVTTKIGEPVTYTLTIKADGLQNSQLPDIAIASNEHFTVYADKPETSNITGRQGIIGTKITHYAIIPKKTGRHTLPAIILKWWNTTTDKEEILRLQPQTLTVAKTELTQQSLPTKPATSDTAETIETPNNTVQVNPFWQWLSVLLALLLLIFIALWFYQRSIYQKLLNNNIDRAQQPEEFKENLKKNTTENMVALYKLIETAIQEKQWLRLRQHLIQWAEIKTQKNITSTDDINAFFPDLQMAVSTLDKQLYSDNRTVVWDYQELIPLLKKQKLKKSKKQIENLQPLYPE